MLTQFPPQVLLNPLAQFGLPLTTADVRGHIQTCAIHLGADTLLTGTERDGRETNGQTGEDGDHAGQGVSADLGYGCSRFRHSHHGGGRALIHLELQAQVGRARAALDHRWLSRLGNRCGA